MSISLALVPVALALRVVMGKERFESWVESLQVRIPTEFKDEADLLLTVRKAGYDADRFGGAIKTHVRGEEFYFFWEQVGGAWTAVFANSDSRPCSFDSIAFSLKRALRGPEFALAFGFRVARSGAPAAPSRGPGLKMAVSQCRRSI